MFLKDFVYICLSWPAALEHGQIEENSVNSGVFKGLGKWGNWKHCKKYVLERFYGDKCVNYRVLKEHIAKTCKHTSKNTGFGGFCGKTCRQRCKMSFGQFFLSLGGPHAGEKIKKTPIARIPSGGGGNRGPGRPGLRMAAKLFEMEMQITCTNAKKKQQLCKLLKYPTCLQKCQLHIDPGWAPCSWTWCALLVRGPCFLSFHGCWCSGLYKLFQVDYHRGNEKEIVN